MKKKKLIKTHLFGSGNTSRRKPKDEVAINIKDNSDGVFSNVFPKSMRSYKPTSKKKYSNDTFAQTMVYYNSFKKTS